MKDQQGLSLMLLVVVIAVLAFELAGSSARTANADGQQEPHLMSFTVTADDGGHVIWRMWSDGRIERRQFFQLEAGSWIDLDDFTRERRSKPGGAGQ